MRVLTIQARSQNKARKKNPFVSPRNSKGIELRKDTTFVHCMKFRSLAM